jgi:hypothetical protein
VTIKYPKESIFVTSVVVTINGREIPIFHWSASSSLAINRVVSILSASTTSAPFSAVSLVVLHHDATVGAAVKSSIGGRFLFNTVSESEPVVFVSFGFLGGQATIVSFGGDERGEDNGVLTDVGDKTRGGGKKSGDSGALITDLFIVKSSV